MVDDTETHEDGTTTLWHCDEEGEFCEPDDAAYRTCETGLPPGDTFAYTVALSPGDAGRICP